MGQYRLPTEAEWEYACRAGSTAPYSFEMDPAAGRFPANLHGIAYDSQGQLFSWQDAFRHTAPVGSYPPNPWGLHDMHGNAMEMCSDAYDDTIDYYRESSRSDPQGPEPTGWRVARGGGFHSTIAHARSASRSRVYESIGLPFAGFRVVKTY